MTNKILVWFQFKYEILWQLNGLVNLDKIEEKGVDHKNAKQNMNFCLNLWIQNWHIEHCNAGVKTKINL